MNNAVIFAGIIRKEPNCGESMKNHIFIDQLKTIYDKVYVVELAGPKKHPWRFIHLLIKSFLHPNIPIFVSYSSNQAYQLFRLLNLFHRKNIYYWVIGGAFHKKLLQGQFKVDVYRNIEKIFVESTQMTKCLNEIGLQQVERVPNFKPINYIPDISSRDYSGTVRFVFLSRIHHDKGCNLIIEAARKLNSIGLKNKYIVDFYGPFYPEYKQSFLDSIKDLENVNYKGFLNLRDETGYDILSSYHVMLFPTFWIGEGFPGVIIDAYIAGLPVIASDWNFNREIVNGNGIIIESKNIEALVSAMKDVIDSTNLRKMSLNCQADALDYDVKKVISKESLNQLLKK